MIYKPTVKELQIFCGYTTEEFSEPYQVLEHASRLAKVDAGFIGMGPDEYDLKGEKHLGIEIYDGEWTSIDIYGPETIDEDSIIDFKCETDIDYSKDFFKAFMFRLVLLWMKQQGGK
jgi:hypothetical protein